MLVEPISRATYGELRVSIFDNAADLGLRAAQDAAGFLARAILARSMASVVLATGNSQLAFVESLRTLPGIEWARITTFHMDEYLGISADHPASFRRYIRQRLTDHVKPARSYFIEGDALDPAAEVERYARLLRARPLDLCCMGIGENGHLAFNDPPVNFDEPAWVKIVELAEECRRQQVGEGHFASVAETPPRALTMTIPALLSAEHLLVIAPEVRKASAVRRALEGPIDGTCPASILRRQPHAHLYLDRDSASLLSAPGPGR